MNGTQNQPDNQPGTDPAEGAGPTAAHAAQQAPAYPPPYAPHGGGYPQAPPPVTAQDPRTKSPGLAYVLSVVPGLGQVYVGYYQRGFTHVIVVAVLITILSTGEFMALAPLLGIFLAFFWLYNIIDAGRRAGLYNQALVGEESIAPPSDFAMQVHGSILGGLTLIAGGSIVLAHTAFGMPLQWIEHWWPVAPMVLGAWLLIKAIQDRAAPAGND